MTLDPPTRPWTLDIDLCKSSPEFWRTAGIVSQRPRELQLVEQPDADLYFRLPNCPTPWSTSRFSPAFGRRPRGSGPPVQFLRTVPSTSRPALDAGVN